MKNYNISIIIPHYNSPGTLLRLIESIPITEDIQVIVVDDNSTVNMDACVERLKERENLEYYKNDSGNKGAGAARNIGLAHASGSWLLFADADDFFVKGAFDVIQTYVDTAYDLVYFPPTSMDERTGEESSRHVFYMDLVNRYTEKQTIRREMELRYLFCTPWSKMIRREIVEAHKLHFDEILVSNDIMFVTMVARHARQIAASSETVYCVTRGGGTLTSVKNEANFDTRVDVLVRRYNYLRDNLSKKELSYTHVDRIALARLADAVMEHWGFKKIIYILRIYKDNRIRFFDWGLLNPVTVVKKAVIQIKWWMDIRKNRS